MHGDFGYMEEGKLGRPYDFRLLKRLSRYAYPYKKTFSAALFLTILITLFDLAVPYVTKIAIDRYILASWYSIRTEDTADSKVQNLLNRYTHLMKKGLKGDSYFISNLNMKKLDPADMHTLKSRGMLSNERFYMTDEVIYESVIPPEKENRSQVLADGSVLIPYDLMAGISKEDRLRLRAGDIRGVTLVAAIFLMFILISFALSYFEYYLLEFTGQHIMQDIRLALFKKMQSHTVRFFNHNPAGRLVTRVTNDIENLNEMFKSVFVTVFKDIFILAGILIILLLLNRRLAFVCFTLIPVIFGLAFLFSTIAREAFRQLRATVSKINSFLQERLSGMRIIQLFVRETYQMAIFNRINHENYLAGMKQIRVFAVFMPFMELLSSIGIALVIWHGGGKVIQEQLTLGALVAFIGYIQMFFKPIRDISEKYNIMQSAM
ncbi:MAG: ABC transporter ATP-binding protein, partial [Deltaproteobacteria bacterium]|nr:ABC transporter ATP-binding protein [Deltaproteobacteria bacterium]